MNKSELIDKVATDAGISKKDAGAAVNAAINAVAEQLKAGEKVSILGFGTFETRARAARTGRNPATGEKIKIKASKSPAFKAGKALKTAVNEKKAAKSRAKKK